MNGLPAMLAPSLRRRRLARERVVDTKQLPASSTVEVITEALKSSTTAYDVANAITSVARARTDTAARLTLEEVGHRYLSRAAA